MPAPDPTPKVNCRYGAPMGRRSIVRPSCDRPKLYLNHVPLDSGGYDKGGAYWGLGQRLYCAVSADPEEEIDLYFRARNREAAKEYVRQEIPGARFFR